MQFSSTCLTGCQLEDLYASDMGLRAVFQEKEDGRSDIVEYASGKLSPQERCYCTAEEVLTVEGGLLESFGATWKVGNSSYTLKTHPFSGFIVCLVQNQN